MTEFFYNSDKVKKAYKLASELFLNKKDLNGNPYIEHLIRVANSATVKYRDWAYSKEPIAAYKSDFEDVHCAALLHDVLEDTDYPSYKIKEDFENKITDLVNLITKLPWQDYKDYINQIASDVQAICIKLADLEDNMDIKRFNKPLKEKDLERLKKYHNSWLLLKERLDKL